MSYNVSNYGVYDRKLVIDAITAVRQIVSTDEAIDRISTDWWENCVVGHPGIRSSRLRIWVEHLSAYQEYRDGGYTMTAEQYAEANRKVRADTIADLKALSKRLTPRIVEKLMGMGITNCRMSIVYQPYLNLTINILYKSGKYRIPFWKPKIGDEVEAFPSDEPSSVSHPVSEVKGIIRKFVITDSYYSEYRSWESNDHPRTARHYIVECTEEHPYGYHIGELFEAHHIFES
jgi:hypothetical protein